MMSSAAFPRWLSMGSPRTPARTVLFERERTGLTYRVPSLLPVPPGPTLLAFVEQRLSPDDAHAHRRWVAKVEMSKPGSWGALHVLGTAALAEHRSMNPCPVHDAGTGTVFLFFIAVLGHTPEAVQIATGRNAARLCCVTSHDAGLTWGSARDLTEEAIGSAVQGRWAGQVGRAGGQGRWAGHRWKFPFCPCLQPQGDQPSLSPGLSCAPRPSPTWLLYSHPVGRRARLHMGIRLSRSPLDPNSWTGPWVVYEGPSGYSDLASIVPAPGGGLVFACLFENGARTSYEEISFCTFSLRDVLENVPAGPEPPTPGDKPRGRCWPS
uniref:exo-alpha-sialidase n=1 Tax=Aotus nancymaae TaxID=37293 RepID=A0A2K5CJA5_AOTNA